MSKIIKKFKNVMIMGAVMVPLLSGLLWAQGLTVPVGSLFNINNSTVHVPGDIVISGTLQTTTGEVGLTGDWSNSGAFVSNTGTVDFYGTVGTQLLNSSGIGTGKLFYNLEHTGASTLQLSTNDLDVDGTLINSAGTLHANGQNISVAGNWNNQGTFTHGSATVTFDGTLQALSGNSTFFGFDKTTTVTDTLTFDNTAEQIVTGSLILQGTLSNLLSLRSDTDGSQFDLTLQAGGGQLIQYVDVKDSNAGNGLTLVGGITSVNSLNNNNWVFGATIVTWQGDVSSDWETPGNWDSGFVPTSVDEALIPDVTGGGGVQPVLTASVVLYDLTVQSGATMTLDQQDLTITNTFSNDGIILLTGNETLTITTMDVDSGTFEFIGDNDISENFTITDFGTTDYYNVTINDTTGGNADSFLTNADLTIAGTLTVIASVMDVSTNTNQLTVNGNIVVNGGTLTATNGNVDANGDITLSAGTLTAPGAAQTLTLAGDFTSSGGTFTPSSGVLTLDGTNQTLSGNTTFYGLTKAVITADTLTFDNTSLQTVSNALILTGTSGNVLSINSDSVGNAANLTLQAGATQSLDYLEVRDSDASGGITLVARNSSEPNGGNTNWVFGASTVTWQGDDGSTPTDWDTAANWDLGFVPTSVDTAVVASVVNDPTLATAVTVLDLTVADGATLTLAGLDLTVSGTLSNEGTVNMNGTETLTITAPDTDSGTFVVSGDNNGSANTLSITDFGTTDYYNLTINDINATPDTFVTSGTLTVANNLIVSAGFLDISTGTDTLITTGTLMVGGGTLTATNGAIDADGSVVVSAGTLTAPTTGQSFTVARGFAHSGGTFTHSSGGVTLDTTLSATLSGNTTFYDLSATAAAKTITFTAGSNQTINNTLTLIGNSTNDIVLRSSVDGTPWTLTVPGGNQGLQFLDVKDADAEGNDIYCFSCTNSGGNDDAGVSPQWIFQTLAITVPINSGVIDETPTVIGVADPGDIIILRDKDNVAVATVTADANGNFRVELADADNLDVGVNTLTPEINGAPGASITVVVQSAPTTDNVPTITSHTNGERVNGATPTITGKGLAGGTVTIFASDSDGNLLLQNVGSGTIDGSGNYSVSLSTDLPRGDNDLSAVVNDISSDIVRLKLTDPFGVIFDTETNLPVSDAVITLMRAADDQPATIADGDLAVGDVNPLTTGSDGFFSFIAADADYYMTVNAAGYFYPTVTTNFPVGRTIVLGSKGETFTVAGTIIEMDQPADPNDNLLRVVKDANKAEVRVGDIVTYTVTIENISQRSIDTVYLADTIPPGFKYVNSRVTLDGVPIAEPTGQRPVLFSVGTFAIGVTKTLKYQLVVGSGVSKGSYENSAVAQWVDGQLLSNRSRETVEVVLDPLFDLGTVIGKVFYDRNENGLQDKPRNAYEALELPVPHVRLVTEDGTVVTADKNGQFSLPSLMPGRHVLRLDERSLPPGSYLTTDKAVVVDVTPGILVKVNFGVNLDGALTLSEDQQFFSEQIVLRQEKGRPVPRLHVAMFEKEVVMHHEVVIEEVEFRIFTNYAAFIDKWRLEIVDQDIKEPVKVFEGNALNIHDPIVWVGKNDQGQHIRADHRYAYRVVVYDKPGHFDDTQLRSIAIKKFDTEEDFVRYQETQEKRDAQTYMAWVSQQEKENTLLTQTIRVEGETLIINPQQRALQQLHIVAGKKLVVDMPMRQAHGLTARELLEGKMTSRVTSSEVDIILPNGDYDIVVQERTESFEGPTLPLAQQGGFADAQGTDISQQLVTGSVKSYSKPIKVGEDYLFFVAMGDAKIGYTFNRGDVEALNQNDQFKEGFWSEGKLAYHVKGKIKGKYLITSSFDSERHNKDIFKSIDKESYYPVYGDASSVNYDAANSQGNLYLLIEWDKSSILWGNYSVAFGDTEFAQFSRSLYGGKINFESMATTKHGESRSKAVLFHARAKQRSAHVEFLSTGGSLYFLRNQDVVGGSDKIKAEVRDKVTGLVLSSKELKSGIDYELDRASGRLVLWQPVGMLMESYSIISNDLLNGNPIYLVADYEYLSKDKIDQANVGGRVRQAIGDNILVGGTYVKEQQAASDYELRGTDVTVHLGKDATVTAEYAESISDAVGTFVSTDGGLSFDQISSSVGGQDRAYGIKGDATLFNRLALSSHYKWVGNEFSSTATAAQQGKELLGVSAVYDISDKTRVTARYDVQKLIDDGNVQTQMQLGATRTATTLLQMVHESHRLKLTAEYKRQEVRERKEQFVSETNQETDTIAIQADYALTDKIDVSVRQQHVLQDEDGAKTTIAVKARPTDKIQIGVEKTLGEKGLATSVDTTIDMTGNLALKGKYSLEGSKDGTITNTGEASVGAVAKINDKLEAEVNVGMTDIFAETPIKSVTLGGTSTLDEHLKLQTHVTLANAGGNQSTTVSLGGESQLTEDTKIDTRLSVGQSAGGNAATSLSIGGESKIDEQTKMGSRFILSEAGGQQTSELTFGGTAQVDENTQTATQVSIKDAGVGRPDRSVTFGTQKKIGEDLQLATTKTFGNTGDKTNSDSKYSLIKEKDGKKFEGSVARSYADSDTEKSQSNIFGLSGDINDRWAVEGHFERGEVQNTDGTETNRNVLSAGVGYVKKDEETGDTLKSSTKLELRFDKGDVSRRQYLAYSTIEGKLNEAMTVFSKLEFSRTKNTTTGAIEAEHKEVIIGGGYRPIAYDKLNFLARYTYMEGQAPDSQVNQSDIEDQRTHVFSGEGIYDITDRWQISEKFAYRMGEEKVTGFAFTKTRTWLMIHRVNYKYDRDWSIGGEFRMLRQEEAQDSRVGFLFEVARKMGEFAQLGIGYNFTDFNDDLANQDYTAQGPFLRMTGKFYDRTPEEIERSRQRWLNAKITRWAWQMVLDELRSTRSPVLDQLNEYFVLAREAFEREEYETSKEIYRDIVTAAQMMVDEASEYIQGRVSKEEQLEEMSVLADQYFKNGQYDKAKKILEKILEEAR